MALLVASACGYSGSAPSVTGPREVNECPKLDSALVRLSRSAHPESLAAESAIPINGPRARVIVQIAAGAEPQLGVDFEIEARYADQLQGWVRFDRLCALAQEALVVAVTPARPGTLLAPRQ